MNNKKISLIKFSKKQIWRIISFTAMVIGSGFLGSIGQKTGGA